MHDRGAKANITETQSRKQMLDYKKEKERTLYELR